MGFGRYIKTAFLNRWNQLFFWGGIGLAVVSGRPDIVAPLVMAGEVAYLGLLGTHPRFQKYVDARDHARRKESEAGNSDRVLKRIVRAIPRESYRRFERLRERCLELRQIAADLKDPAPDSPGSTLDSFQLADLDRLLWIFLRLLFTQHSLARFLDKTKVGKIQNDIKQLEGRLEYYGEENLSPHDEKIRRTLLDNLETSRSRLANYEKAEANYELVELELDRLENKIKSLSEMAVNRQEPDYISQEVDQVTESMLETEKTMNELEFATGLGEVDDEVPELLHPRVEVVN